mgnify:CR=1 FL=1
MKNKLSAERAIKILAQRDGVSEDEIIGEIEKAIKIGMGNSDPKVQKKWKELYGENRTPTAEKLITKIAEYIVK